MISNLVLVDRLVYCLWLLLIVLQILLQGSSLLSREVYVLNRLGTQGFKVTFKALLLQLSKLSSSAKSGPCNSNYIHIRGVRGEEQACLS